MALQVNVATLCIHLTAAVDTFFDPNEGRPVVAVVSQLVLSGTFVFLWILGVKQKILYPLEPKVSGWFGFPRRGCRQAKCPHQLTLQVPNDSSECRWMGSGGI